MLIQCHSARLSITRFVTWQKWVTSERSSEVHGYTRTPKESIRLHCKKSANWTQVFSLETSSTLQTDQCVSLDWLLPPPSLQLVPSLNRMVREKSTSFESPWCLFWTNDILTRRLSYDFVIYILPNQKPSRLCPCSICRYGWVVRRCCWL